jgi:hypothetical protein
VVGKKIKLKSNKVEEDLLNEFRKHVKERVKFNLENKVGKENAEWKVCYDEIN